MCTGNEIKDGGLRERLAGAGVKEAGTAQESLVIGMNATPLFSSVDHD